MNFFFSGYCFRFLPSIQNDENIISKSGVLIWTEHLPEASKTSPFRDLVIVMQFLTIFSNEHQKVQPINHQQKCLRGIPIGVRVITQKGDISLVASIILKCTRMKFCKQLVILLPSRRSPIISYNI